VTTDLDALEWRSPSLSRCPWAGRPLGVQFAPPPGQSGAADLPPDGALLAPRSARRSADSLLT
jgi:hypothetical protein